MFMALHFNESMVKDYKVLELLGQGTFGSVYKVLNVNTQQVCALKSISLNTGDKGHTLTDISNEIKLLSTLDCEYIVKSYESFQSDDGNMLYIVMEYCDGGDLSKLICEKNNKNTMIDEKTLLSIFFQICKGLEYLHSMKILHRDLKTMNIFLFKDGRVKIGDLGVAKVLMNTLHARTFIGTPYYLAPELCEDKPYDEKSDVWSLGCILYEMIALKRPFNAQNQLGLFMKIMKGIPEQISSNILKCYNAKLFKLLDNMLEKNVRKRFSIRQVLTSEMMRQMVNKEEKMNSVKVHKPVLSVKKKLSACQISNKEIAPKRVRVNPKNKAGNSQLSRQAVLASDNRYAVQPSVINEIHKISQKNEEDCGNDNNINENSHQEMTATAFFKQLLKSEYDNIIKPEENDNPHMNANEEPIGIDIPIIDEVNVNVNVNVNINATPSLLEENQNQYPKNLNDLVTQAHILIGKENYEKIINVYETMTQETRELTDEDSELLDQVIKSIINGDQDQDQDKDKDKDTYVSFLEIFFQIVYLKYMQETKLKFYSLHINFNC